MTTKIKFKQRIILSRNCCHIHTVYPSALHCAYTTDDSKENNFPIFLNIGQVKLYYKNILKNACKKKKYYLI